MRIDEGDAWRWRKCLCLCLGWCRPYPPLSHPPPPALHLLRFLDRAEPPAEQNASTCNVKTRSIWKENTTRINYRIKQYQQKNMSSKIIQLCPNMSKLSLFYLLSLHSERLATISVQGKSQSGSVVRCCNNSVARCCSTARCEVCKVCAYL